MPIQLLVRLARYLEAMLLDGRRVEMVWPMLLSVSVVQPSLYEPTGLECDVVDGQQLTDSSLPTIQDDC